MFKGSTVTRVGGFTLVGWSFLFAQSTSVIRTLVYHEITSVTGNIQSGNSLGPFLSRNGARAVYELGSGNLSQLFVLNADGNSPPVLVDSYTASCSVCVQISPNDDASAVATNDRTHIRYVRTDGSGGRTLLAASDDVPFSAIRLSSSGNKIFFLMAFEKPVNGSMTNTPAGLYTLNPDGTGLTQIVSTAAVQTLLGTSSPVVFDDGNLALIDISADNSRIIFTATADVGQIRAGRYLLGFETNGQRLHILSGPNIQTNDAALSADGSTVYFSIGPLGGGSQAVVMNFDGSNARTLATGLTGSGPPGQITADGSQVIVTDGGNTNNTDRVYRTDGSGFYLLAMDDGLGASVPVIRGDFASMNSTATRFLTLVPDVARVRQLVTIDLNPGGFGAAPAIANPSLSPPFVLTLGHSTSSAGAQITAPGETLLGGSAWVVSAPPSSKAGLPDPDIGPGALSAIGNGTYSYNSIRTDCCAATGPRYVRIQAEDRVGASGSRRHATAIDVAPFAVVASANVNVTVATSPPGLSVVVDGIRYTAPQAFTWSVSESHTIEATSPQRVSGTTYTFSSWSDGGAQSHGVTAPSTATTYTATFSSAASTPNLTINKTHSGSFSQGQTGAAYTITAGNSGNGSTSGTVTITDNLPAGLTVTAISGSGWTCGGTTCSRSDPLPPNTAYPPIILTVNVAANAPPSLTNSAIVSGGGDTNSHTSSDPTVITPSAPSLRITKTHSASFFVQRQTGAYTITVSNVGQGSTSGTVTVSDSLPTGLTVSAISGSGWSCAGTTCSRSDPLGPNNSYPPITLTVNVAANAPFSLTNSATVSGGGDSTSHTATDPTTIVGLIEMRMSKSHTGNFSQGQIGASYTINIDNIGTATSTAPVSVTDTVPSGLTLTNMSGTGWNCSGTTCSRSDLLAANTAYPPITVTVNVAANAPASVTNTATLTGGGVPTFSAADSTTILSAGQPGVSITKTHSGNFTQGQQGAKYTLTVSNAAGAVPTSGLVIVSESVPAGLTLVSMSGTGWICSGTSCVRDDSLAGGSSFPPITVTVNVAANAPSPVVNQANVAGDGIVIVNASDPTTVNPPGGGNGVTLTMGNGSAAPGGTVQVPINIATSGSLAANFQVDMNFEPAKVTFVSSSAGPQLSSAGKSLSTNLLSSGVVRLIASGLNQNTIGDGVVGNIVFGLNPGFAAGGVTPITLNNCRSSDGNGAFLTTNCVAGSIRSVGLRCDLNGNGVVEVGDVQIIVNMVLGDVPAVPQADLNGDGVVNVADVQMMINVVLALISCPA